jgi:hypothetical protein
MYYVEEISWRELTPQFDIAVSMLRKHMMRLRLNNIAEIVYFCIYYLYTFYIQTYFLMGLGGRPSGDLIF